jgi:CRISPR-associated endonuclease/helicase Cas3
MSLYFEEVFSEITGFQPFRWQSRFYEEWFSKGKIPSFCEVPTGLGKTSIMVLWLIARAAEDELPRRLVYVVDRRAVVDQATRFAERIKNKSEEVLGIKDVPISTLRGKYVDNRRWLEDPTKPAIIVGTVDMIGSRILFSGYGVSSRMRPYHAGMLGADTLFILDEAHLIPPFESLMRDISKNESLKTEKEEYKAIVPPIHVLPLSATFRPSGT